MGYSGDLDQVTPTDEHKENLKRFVPDRIVCLSKCNYVCLQGGDEDSAESLQGQTWSDTRSDE